MPDLFVPRPCQGPMIDIMSSTGRCNVFASPGTGKTTACLAALSTLALLEDRVWPVLVVAPKRVANSVWDAEVEAWADFQGIAVSKLLGSPEQRLAALRARADLYTINPANLVWLVETLNGKWPFGTVVCDESTTVKGHRCHFRKSRKGGWHLVAAGGKRARALVKRAFHTPHWINLTGTPAPNGVQDLWGQQWPIDFGKALGRTHSAFTRRWFRPAFGSTPEQQRIEALPGAEDEIMQRLRPTSQVIDAYDWFDVDKPVEVTMKVQLPPSARKTYDRIHKDSVLDLEEHGFDVTAANAGSLVMKCRQIASGHLKDDEGCWHTLHDAKLEALKELLEKLDGRPLLVAYWFKRDLAAITEAFPQAVELPSGAGQKETENRWNEGRIPMLLAHPQSAGHGLNLQHGGNNLCIYTQDWNSEYRDQVVERIGPVRQAQSGYHRAVYVHSIIAENTWEEAVAKKLKNKWSVQQAVREALK